MHATIAFRMCLVSIAVLGASAFAAPWLTAQDYGKLHLVVSDDALAATEFATYWEACTGHAVSRSAQPGDGVNVFVGRDAVPERFLKKLALDGMDPDGVRLLSVNAANGAAPSLIVAGGVNHGSLYGVYEFFERYIGVRWLAAGDTFIPLKPGATCDPGKPWERATPSTLHAIDYRYEPPFEYRHTTYSSGNGIATYLNAQRLSQGPQFGPGLFVHTAYGLLPPEKHFADHPEWYSEVDGKRMAPVGYDYHNHKEREKHPGTVAQLCFSNPAVADAIIEELRGRIRKNPECHIWSVSQMDWARYCTCPECKAIDEREGTPMGSLLTCVNRVAEAIDAEFPGHYIETLAYTWSRQAPKTLRPRDNVIIRLCSIECDFAHPLDDPKVPENAGFAQDIREWSKIAKQLYIWDYTVNFHAYQRPHPNLMVLKRNVQFFRDHKVRGLFEQGMSEPRAELGNLRTYLLAKAIWNPDCDLDAARDDFLDLYYRETAPFMREYLALLEKTVIEKNWMMDTFDKGGWIDYDLVLEAREILNNAHAAAQSEETRRRIAFAQVSVEFAAITCAPRITLGNNTMTVERPPCLSAAEYIALAKSFGISEYAENNPIAEFGDTPGQCPPRKQQSPIEILENEHYLVWVAPAIDGSVIRWQDKRSGVELINAFRDYGARPCTWQDWTNTPFRVEGPVAPEYTVAARSSGSLTLEAAREDGLVVRRTMTLKPGSDRIDVTLSATNPTSGPLTANVKPHPEFYAQGGFIPEMWGCRNGKWERFANAALRPQVADGLYLKPEGYTQLACHVKEEKATVICEFDPAQLGGLLWFYNSSNAAQQMNLELLPKDKPLASGETMTISASYRFTRKSPAAL